MTNGKIDLKHALERYIEDGQPTLLHEVSIDPVQVLKMAVSMKDFLS